MIFLVCIVCIYLYYTLETTDSFQDLNGEQIAGLSIGSTLLFGILIFGVYFRHEWLKFSSLRQYIHI